MDKRATLVVAASGAILFGLVQMLRYRALKNHEHKCWERNQEKVDTASEDSFPASDPPAYTPAQSAEAVL